MPEITTLKGMHDFLPTDMYVRRYVIDKIRNVFEKYGYEPLETPALEYYDVLSAKYGEEERLIYRFQDYGGREVGLRFDLTVPLARVLASHNELPLPFRRYQIQPVWRAEKPQKGRFREFYQCDVDLVGIKSMAADAEIIAIIYDTLKALGFDKFTIRINNRKILQTIAERLNLPADKYLPFFRAIDKLDKKGWPGVVDELMRLGLTDSCIEELKGVLKLRDVPTKIMSTLRRVLGDTEGLSEMESLFQYLDAYGIPTDYTVFDVALARGLDYYTGPIHETAVDVPKIGSITGGGRYDRLLEIFTGKPIPAVGTTLGLERIIIVMKETGMIPASAIPTRILMTIFDTTTYKKTVELAQRLRAIGVNVALYPEFVKLSKQLKYADKANIPWVIVMGPDELAEGTFLLRDMKSGNQYKIKLTDYHKVKEYIDGVLG